MWLTVCRGEPSPDDSLQGALDAINRRQRDLDDPTLYYLEHFHSPRDLIYPHHVEGTYLVFSALYLLTLLLLEGLPLLETTIT